MNISWKKTSIAICLLSICHASLAQNINRYKPTLYVQPHACNPDMPFRSDGKPNGGLKPTGSTNGKCKLKDGRGEAIVRHTKNTGITDEMRKYGIQEIYIYSYYFRKDQGVRISPPAKAVATAYEAFGGKAGHRHDWEEIVVFSNFKNCVHYTVKN